MFSNYLRIAIRQLIRNKSFTIINILGLSIGMTICLMTLLYVEGELTFDRFHKNKDRLYRLILSMESSAEGSRSSCEMTAGIGPSLLEEIPQVEAMVRFSSPREGFFYIEDRNFNLRQFMYADSSVFRVFSFPMLAGDPGTSLKEPYSVVLTRTLADKIFGQYDRAMGKVIRFNDRDNLLVTGILEDVPRNSHLQFEALVSFTSLYQDPNLYLDWNGGHAYFTYLLLKEGTELSLVERMIEGIAEENINRDLRQVGISWNFFLQPLLKVHLNTVVDYDLETRTTPQSLWILVAITLVILLVACVNFINLSAAASLGRMKEIGIRKVTGALRQQVVMQFLTESLLVSLISFLVAIVFMDLFYQFFANRFPDFAFFGALDFSELSWIGLSVILILLVLVVGIVAGAYPAYTLAKINPAYSVKGQFLNPSGNPRIRSLLVVFQFTVSIIMIICTLLIAGQLRYLLTKDKGFETDNRIIIPLGSEQSRAGFEAIKAACKAIPGVEDAGASSDIPGKGFTMNGYFPEGFTEPMMIHALDVDYDYLRTMGLKMVQGRQFSKEYGQDAEAYIINQELARQLGWSQSIGKTIRRGGDHKVIGVVKDFHYSSLHSRIEPLLITLKPWQGYDYITLKLNRPADEKFREELELAWSTVVPTESLEVISLSQYVREAYSSEKLTLDLLIYCSLLAITIASLGLLALAAYMTRRRYREIAVRKVFGAVLSNIFVRVSSGFLKWVVAANLLAWPLAYLIMDNYLSNFAYSAGIDWWIFLIVFAASSFLSLVIIFYQVIRLGKLNPVEYIRYE